MQELLERLERGEVGDPLPVLAYVAGRDVDPGEDEVREAQRRALLLLAAGGDPRRELTVDEPAVKSIAGDLFSDGRRARLGAAIDDLVLRARDLPRVRAAALFLAADVDLAWRLYGLGLLAEGLE